MKIQPLKSIVVNDIDDAENIIFEKMFNLDNYYIIEYNVKFYRVIDNEIKNRLKRETIGKLKSGNYTTIKYIEIPLNGRLGDELIDLFNQIINESICIAYTHDKEKIMYLYSNIDKDINIEDERNLMKTYID